MEILGNFFVNSSASLFLRRFVAPLALEGLLQN